MLRYVISGFCSRGFLITLAGLKNIVCFTGKIVIKGSLISGCHCGKHLSSSYGIRPASNAHGEGVLIKLKIRTGRLHPEVQTLNLSYTYLHRSGTPFTYPKQNLNHLYISKISRNSRSSRDFSLAL